MAGSSQPFWYRSTQEWSNTARGRRGCVWSQDEHWSDLTSDSHPDPAVTPMQNLCKFMLEWSSYKLFPLKYVFIFDSLQVSLRKLLKRSKLFQNNLIWKASKWCIPAHETQLPHEMGLNISAWDRHLIEVNLQCCNKHNIIYKADIKI